MDNVMMTVRAKFLTTPKSPGVPGVLMLNDNKFQWKSNDPNVASHLDVQFQAIKGLRANKENPKFKKALLNMGKDEEMKEGYLFEFNNFVDRDECRNLVAKILQKYQLEGGSKLPSEGQSKPSLAEPSFPREQLNRKVMDRRMKLLSEDMELQKLHQQLVINGVISEADFWAARKTHDEDALKFQKQRVGLKSAMLTDVRPIHDGRTNKVTFNLTSDIIHQIFAEKPAVHRAFLSNVPSKMTEVEFWTKYCRADLIHRTHIQAAVAAEAEADEQLAIFLKDDDIIASETKKKIRKVDPTVDMTADVADYYLSLPGHGIFRDGSKENVVDDATQIKRMLVHDINRHASVVLDGRVLDVEGLRDTTTVAHALLAAKEGSMPPKEDEGTLMQKRSERVHEMTKVDDLEGPRAPPYVPLCIQDPRSYFDSQRPNVTEIGSLDAGTKLSSVAIPTHPDEVLSAFSQQCEQLRAKISIDAAVVPDVAARVLNELTQYISNRKFQVGKTAGKNILNSLPRSTRDELLQLSAVSHELLRHFWAAHPLTSVAYKEKASRIKDALVDIHGKLQTLKQGAKPEYRHHLSQLVQPVIQALDAAFSCWENDEKKTVKGFQTVYSTNGVPAPG